MAAPAVNIPPAQANQVPAPESEPRWKIVLNIVAEIAVQTLIPFATTFLVYLVTPVSIAAIVLPIAAVASAFSVSFLYASKMNPIVQIAHLLATVICGLRNAGCNCWLNSLVQVMRCDQKMKSWFEGVPHDLPNPNNVAGQPPLPALSLAAHLAAIPYLPPSISSRIPDVDAAIPAELNAIVRLDLADGQFEQLPANLDHYLNEIHPEIKRYREAAAPTQELTNKVRTLLSTYYPANYPADAAALLQAIQNPQFLIDLYRIDRQRIARYFQVIGRVPNSARYVHLLAQVPQNEVPGDVLTVTVRKKWDALVKFKQFMDAYNRAEAGNIAGPLNFNTQELRLALHEISPPRWFDDPSGISVNAGQQLDPTEALTPIVDQLMPANFKVSVETRQYYHLDGQPRFAAGGNVLPEGDGKSTRVVKHSIPIPISRPERANNLRALIDLEMDNPSATDDPAKVQGEDGVEYLYRPRRTVTQYVQAPSSLWVPLNRYRYVKSGSWECLTRFLPNWFAGVPRGAQKIETPVDVQDTLDIQPIEGGPVRYKLDGFIRHHGANTNNGHYISYKLGKDAVGNDVWCEMNDSLVKPLSNGEAKKLRDEALVFHYSPIVAE